MTNSTHELIYEYNGVSYPLIITYKRIKNTYFRYKDGAFYVTSNPRVSEKRIVASLDKYAPKLLKIRKNKQKPYSLKDGYVYVFGECKHLDNKLCDEVSLKKILKVTLIEYLNEQVRYYEKEMDISPSYKIKVKDMSSRHGSNSRQTRTISFQLSLVHYKKEIIDSVIVHELAHDKVFNHSKKFYDIVYQYCPNYKKYKKELRNGEF